MGRIEGVSRRERRRRWTDAEKLRLLSDAEASGLGVAEFARRHDLYPQQLYQWRRDFRALWAGGALATDAVTFLPIELSPSAAQARATKCGEEDAGAAPAMVEIRLTNGRELRVGSEIGVDRLRALVLALEEA